MAEALAKAWTTQAIREGVQLAADAAFDDEEEGMFFSDSRNRRIKETHCL